MTVLHELLWISEKEMAEFENDPGIKRPDRPTRFCVTRGGSIRTWPSLDPKKFTILLKDK